MNFKIIWLDITPVLNLNFSPTMYDLTNDLM